MEFDQLSVSEPPKFHQLFHPGTVRAQMRVRDWREAVRLTGRLLLDDGSVTPVYIEALERVLQELGPYAVIAPGIVLLHARPQDGVLKACMALVTLATPVEFGHSQNDPVDIVLAFGAIDKQSHLQALQHLAEFLGHQQNLAELRSAQTDAALLSVIQSWTGDQ